MPFTIQYSRWWNKTEPDIVPLNIAEYRKRVFKAFEEHNFKRKSKKAYEQNFTTPTVLADLWILGISLGYHSINLKGHASKLENPYDPAEIVFQAFFPEVRETYHARKVMESVCHSKAKKKDKVSDSDVHTWHIRRYSWGAATHKRRPFSNWQAQRISRRQLQLFTDRASHITCFQFQ